MNRGPVPVLTIADDPSHSQDRLVFHGTNSHDRKIGAEAVLRALIEEGAIGLCTTHDLALAEAVADLGPRACNVHFADEVVGGELLFDDRMLPGLVGRSNAIALMRAIGLLPASEG